MEIGHLYEFPRPDLARPYELLNGRWSFCDDPKNLGVRRAYFLHPREEAEATLPFPFPSFLSGVDFHPRGFFWLFRWFDLPGRFPAPRTFLNFGAADYEAEVWLNGAFLGRHKGGYTPFAFDVTEKLRQKNLLAVRMRDPLLPHAPRGKQSALGRPLLVFYRPLCGLWQDVWLEGRGPVHVTRHLPRYRLREGVADLLIGLGGAEGEVALQVTLRENEDLLWQTSVRGRKGKLAGRVVLRLPFQLVRPWSPQEPWLYRLTLQVRSRDGEDSVESYAGFREVRTAGSRVLLNGKPFYQRLVLYQGYFSDGLYTPRSSRLFWEDAQKIRALGFNGVRIHQKIENKKLLFACDVLGLVAWGECPSPLFLTRRRLAAFLEEWKAVLDRDACHPSLIAWVPFNESWGVPLAPFHRPTRELIRFVYRWTKNHDPTRLVVDNSGFDHTKTDLVDIHHYLGSVPHCRRLYLRLVRGKGMEASLPRLLFSVLPHLQHHPTFCPGFRYQGQPILISEYGGFGYYKSEKGSLEELFARWTALFADFPKIAGYGYTQFSDTQHEKNGLVTERRKWKVAPSRIRAANEAVAAFARSCAQPAGRTAREK